MCLEYMTDWTLLSVVDLLNSTQDRTNGEGLTLKQHSAIPAAVSVYGWIMLLLIRPPKCFTYD